MSLFPQIGCRAVTFTWEDDEDDTVCCSTDEEVIEALAVMKSELKSTVKFGISVKGSAEVHSMGTTVDGTPMSHIPNDSVHVHVTCDGCGIKPIVGVRYKCAVREDFDLCDKCEAKEIQPHPMIKIYTPEQAPAAIFVCINEDDREHVRGPHGGRWGRHGPHHGHHGHRGPHHGFHHGHGHGHGPHGFHHGPPPPGVTPPPPQPPNGPFSPPNGPFGGLFQGLGQLGGWGVGGRCGRPMRADRTAQKQAIKEEWKQQKDIWRQRTKEAGLGPSVDATCAPFIAAADAFVEAACSQEGDATMPSYFSTEATPVEVAVAETEQEEVEQQLIDEAMRQSLDFQAKNEEEGSEESIAGGGGGIAVMKKMAQPAFEIVSAEYGDVPHGAKISVTDVLKGLVTPSGLKMVACNKAFTDPCVGTSKRLHVKFVVDGYKEEEELFVREHGELIMEGTVTFRANALPPTTTAATIPVVRCAPVGSAGPTAGATVAAAVEVLMMPSTAKPMARYIRDVTFPDGTSIQPGSILLKTWRIRNDGVVTWPQGTVLACAGGDLLAPHDLAQPVVSAMPGDEVDITVQLRAPQVTGRHVAYFRLRTPDGTYFGQRIWADVRVTEEESDWQVVSGLLVPTAAASAPGSAATSPSVSVEREGEEQRSTIPPPPPPPPVVPMSYFEAPVSFEASPGVEDIEEAPVASAATAASPSATVSSSAQEIWARVWAKELQVLADMGFTDTPALLVLLREHVEIPVSLRPDLNGIPAAEGMQRVVAILLGQSGVLA